MKEYLISTPRLGIRNWIEEDLQPMSAINADPEVMRYFPKIFTEKDTAKHIARMQQQYKDNGYCYFAVDRLDTNEFIGFIGLCKQEFDLGWGTYIDIGWRLKQSAWYQGFATEGAKACLEYGFKIRQLERIEAIAPVVNTPSIHVMKKIGMSLVQHFEHPKLVDAPHLNPCARYAIEELSLYQ
ncbi:MAG: GNAT family N-acetyltransferase [Bacteroidota bacterium]